MTYRKRAASVVAALALCTGLGSAVTVAAGTGVAQAISEVCVSGSGYTDWHVTTSPNYHDWWGSAPDDVYMKNSGSPTNFCLVSSSAGDGSYNYQQVGTDNCMYSGGANVAVYWKACPPGTTNRPSADWKNPSTSGGYHIYDEYDGDQLFQIGTGSTATLEPQSGTGWVFGFVNVGVL